MRVAHVQLKPAWGTYPADEPTSKSIETLLVIIDVKCELPGGVNKLACDDAFGSVRKLT